MWTLPMLSGHMFRLGFASQLFDHLLYNIHLFNAIYYILDACFSACVCCSFLAQRKCNQTILTVSEQQCSAKYCVPFFDYLEGTVDNTRWASGLVHLSAHVYHINYNLIDRTSRDEPNEVIPFCVCVCLLSRPAPQQLHASQTHTHG